MSQREIMLDQLKEYDRLGVQEHYDDMLQPVGKEFTLTKPDFKIVKAAAIRRCKNPADISERKRIGESIFDDLEAGRITMKEIELTMKAVKK